MHLNYLLLVFSIVIIISTAGNVEGSYLFFGNCIPQPVVRNLNMTKYSGVWHEIEKYYSYAESDLSCTSLKYYKPKRRSDGEQFVEFLKRSTRGHQNNILSKSGKLTYSTDTDASEPTRSRNSSTSTQSNGRFEAVFRKANRDYGLKHTKSKEEHEPPEAYWVLGTDYENYSVVWSCENAGIMNFQNVVFLARERNPSMAVRGRAYGVMKVHRLSFKILVATSQEDCPDLFAAKRKEDRTG